MTRAENFYEPTPLPSRPYKSQLPIRNRFHLRHGLRTVNGPLEFPGLIPQQGGFLELQIVHSGEHFGFKFNFSHFAKCEISLHRASCAPELGDWK